MMCKLCDKFAYNKNFTHEGLIMLIIGTNTEDAWRKAVKAVMEHGRTIVSEDGDETKEIIGLAVRILKPTISIDKAPPEYPFHGKALQDYVDQLMTPENRWGFEYTYGERIWNWNNQVNQVEAIIERLAKSPFSRRAVIDLTIPTMDHFPEKIRDPPCLRVICFNIREEKEAPMLPAVKKLHTDVLFRSHDIFGASYANWVALAHLQKHVADEVGRRRGERIFMGELHSYSVSAHIYGRDFEMADRVARSTN